MSLPLSNYIETILNPDGRFRELAGVFPVMGADGEPRMKIDESGIDFDVVFEKDTYTLRCITVDNSMTATRMRAVNNFCANIKNPCILPTRFFEEEMLVFDSADRPFYASVILQKKPAGVRLDKFLSEMSAARETEVLRKIIVSIGRLAKWLSMSGFSHNNISGQTIFVSVSHSLSLTDYRDASSENHPADIANLGILAAVAYIAACNPDYYSAMLHEGISGNRQLRDSAEKLSVVLEKENKAVRLIELLFAVTAGKPDGGSIVDAIVNLSSCPADRLSALEFFEPSKQKVPAAKGATEKIYKIIGEMCDMVVRAFDGTHWHYLDERGAVVISDGFLNAEDFSEGRAVVETGTGYGMIDLSGRYIIEPTMDDIEWDCMTNVAIVTLEGRSALFTRNGEQITGFDYDHILSSGEGLFPVRVDDKYGFIRKDGSVAVDFIYDDANSFKNGYAKVKQGNKISVIGPDGESIAEFEKEFI